jgi:hypothetical protein
MNLEEAKTLLAWMREEGVVHARVGDVEIALPGVPVPIDAGADLDPKWRIEGPPDRPLDPYDNPALFPGLPPLEDELT